MVLLISCTTVYVILADLYTVTDFALVLQTKGLTDTGDYVILSVDKDEIFDPEWFQLFCSSAYQHPYSDRMGNNKACQSLLILTPTANENDEFQSNVLKRSAEEPFKIPINSVIHSSMTLPVYAALAYDAVMVLASALTKAYEKEDMPSGTQVVQQMLNMTYQSKVLPSA